MKIPRYLNRFERLTVNFVEGRYIFLVLSLLLGSYFPKVCVKFWMGIHLSFA